MQNSGTVLLAEDQPDDVFLVQRAFEQAGIPNPMIVVGDGSEVLQYLNGEGPYSRREQFPLPVLILLDLDMPRMTGFEVLAWLRRHPALNYLPVAVFTASTLSPDVARAYRLGANSYLTKPADSTQLAAALKETISYWVGNSLPAPAPFSFGQRVRQ